jgi:hypothetical protein
MVNSKFSRFILFAGTENYEHYRIARGSELGPGEAESLQQYKEIETHFTFDLRKREREFKTNRVLEIGSCVAIPRGEVYVVAAYEVRTSCMPRGGEMVPPLLDNQLPHTSASPRRHIYRPLIWPHRG